MMKRRMKEDGITQISIQVEEGKKGGVQTMWCNPTASSPAASRRRDAQCAGKMEECAGSCFRRRSGESREGAEEAAAAFSRPVRPPHRTSAQNLRVFSFFFFLARCEPRSVSVAGVAPRSCPLRPHCRSGWFSRSSGGAVRCGAVKRRVREPRCVKRRAAAATTTKTRTRSGQTGWSREGTQHSPPPPRPRRTRTHARSRTHTFKK